MPFFGFFCITFIRISCLCAYFSHSRSPSVSGCFRPIGTVRGDKAGVLADSLPLGCVSAADGPVRSSTPPRVRSSTLFAFDRFERRRSPPLSWLRSSAVGSSNGGFPSSGVVDVGLGITSSESAGESSTRSPSSSAPADGNRITRSLSFGK